MRHGNGLILREAQDLYLARLLPPRDPLLKEIEALAAKDGIPISDPEVGRLLEILARASGAQRILELGTAIGYGAICLARGAPQARVLTIDIDPDRLRIAREFVERAGVADRVELVEGPALGIVGTLEGPFDLVYVDAVKTEYRRYLDLLLPRLRVGGTLVFDNLLWGGRIAEPSEEEDAEADALGAFNAYLMMHPQMKAVVLPLSDGIGIATKLRPLMTEMGGPF